MVQQIGPGALKGVLQAGEGGDQDINFSCFDFLNGSNVQVSQFGELFLSHVLRASLAANIHSQPPDLRFMS